MLQKAKVMNTGNLISATYHAKSRMKDYCDLAEEMTKDGRKLMRLKRHECKWCFYSGRLGGQMITARPCMACGVEVTYSSTATDVLCMACATAHKLCKHCGGDVEMRVRRKDWP